MPVAELPTAGLDVDPAANANRAGDAVAGQHFLETADLFGEEGRPPYPAVGLSGIRFTWPSIPRNN